MRVCCAGGKKMQFCWYHKQISRTFKFSLGAKIAKIANTRRFFKIRAKLYFQLCARPLVFFLFCGGCNISTGIWHSKPEIQNADKNADVETEKLFPQSQELSPENADVETETTMERGVSQERGESGERAKERTSERERERGEERERGGETGKEIAAGPKERERETN
jgi:hypothetical protein